MVSAQRRESVLEKAQREAPGDGLPIHVTPTQDVLFRQLVRGLLVALAGGGLLAAAATEGSVSRLYFWGGLLAVMGVVRSVEIASRMRRPRWILRIDAEGLETRPPLATARVRWAEIADIAVPDLTPGTVVVTLGRPTAGGSARPSWGLRRRLKLRARLLGCSGQELRACLLANQRARVFAT